ncbi:hypothetical protein VNI00_004032 [Paramarasmius palmivorus]|uniref:Uncharacterized protein n=1 Tax=Paramarasmius palmivorus TaxID=297713 RepID=A0AAW0DMT5_9AGAR
MLGRTKSVAFSAILIGASLVPVHSFTLSSSCQASLQGLLQSDEAACLNAPAILSSILGSQDDINIPRIMDSYLTSLCSSGSCTNENLAAVARNLTTGCNEDLAALDIDLSGDAQDQIVDLVQQIYPTVREIACLKDNTANQFCATQTLNSLEKLVGGLTFDDPSFLDIFADVQRLLQTGVQSLVCTGCTKEAFSIARSNFPALVSQVDDEVSGFCGASFTGALSMPLPSYQRVIDVAVFLFIDGSVSENITQTANPGVFAAQNQGNGASTVFRSAGMILLGVSGAFVLMA